MKTIIHVNQHIIRANAKNGTNNPPLTVKTYKGGALAQEVDVVDGFGNVLATVVHRPHNPLACGARVWIETQLGVVLRGEE